MGIIVHGFVAEKQGGSGRWLSSPATSENGKIRCHDLSGFMGSWDANPEHLFFPCETPNTNLCNIAMTRAEEYCRFKNILRG